MWEKFVIRYKGKRSYPHFQDQIPSFLKQVHIPVSYKKLHAIFCYTLFEFMTNVTYKEAFLALLNIQNFF